MGIFGILFLAMLIVIICADTEEVTVNNGYMNTFFEQCKQFLTKQQKRLAVVLQLCLFVGWSLAGQKGLDWEFATFLLLPIVYACNYILLNHDCGCNKCCRCCGTSLTPMRIILWVCSIIGFGCLAKLNISETVLLPLVIVWVIAISVFEIIVIFCRNCCNKCCGEDDYHRMTGSSNDTNNGNEDANSNRRNSNTSYLLKGGGSEESSSLELSRSRADSTNSSSSDDVKLNITQKEANELI